MMQEKFRVPTRALDTCRNWNYSGRGNLLHFAVTTGSYDLVEEMVRGEGMNINQGSLEDLTPLQVAAAYHPRRLTLKIMKLLIRCGANPATVVRVKKYAGFKKKTVTILDHVVDHLCDSRVLLIFPRFKLTDLLTGNIIKFLVEEIGLPVTQNVLRKVECDPELLVLCQNASSSPRSLKKLARLAVLKTHKVDKMPDGYIPEGLNFFLSFKEGEDE